MSRLLSVAAEAGTNLSTAAEAVVIVWIAAADHIFRDGHLITSCPRVVFRITIAVVKRARVLSICSGLTLLSGDRQLCIAGSEYGLGTSLVAGFILMLISRQNNVLVWAFNPLKGCFLCKQQRPIYEETARPIGTPSNDHTLPGVRLEVDFHICRERRNYRGCRHWTILFVFQQSEIKA